MPYYNPDVSNLYAMPTLQQGSPVGGMLSDAIAKRLAMANAKKAEAEVPYAALSKLATILSQSAYANAVTPQFQAKLLGQPGVAANLEHPQQMVNNLTSYGRTGSTGNTMNDYIQRELLKISQQDNQGKTESNGALDAIGLGPLGKVISNIFTGNKQAQSPDINQNINPAPNQQPVTPQTPVASTATGETPRGRSPESMAFGQNYQSYNSQIAKGTSQGSEEGKQQAEYGTAAQSVLAQDKSLKTLNTIFHQPVLQDIANTPFINQKAINWYKQTGTPQQKRALGEMESAMNTFIGSSLKMFGSRATDTDVNFLKEMKPSDNDTMDVRLGKWTALKTYTDAEKARIKLANQFMKQGMSKADSEFEASSQINMDAIRNMAYTEAFPPPVNIITPAGKIISLPKKGAQQLIKDHPDYRVQE